MLGPCQASAPVIASMIHVTDAPRSARSVAIPLPPSSPWGAKEALGAVVGLGAAYAAALQIPPARPEPRGLRHIWKLKGEQALMMSKRARLLKVCTAESPLRPGNRARIASR